MAVGKKCVDFNGRWGFVDACSALLAEKLRGNAIVERLTLHRCKIGAVGVHALAKVMGEDNTTLKELGLLCNFSLGDDGTEFMALILGKNRTLESLTLTGAA